MKESIQIWHRPVELAGTHAMLVYNRTDGSRYVIEAHSSEGSMSGYIRYDNESKAIRLNDYGADMQYLDEEYRDYSEGLELIVEGNNLSSEWQRFRMMALEISMELHPYKAPSTNSN